MDLTRFVLPLAAKGAARPSSKRMRTVKVQATAAIEKPAVYTPKAHGPIILNGQVLHSISQERLELVNSMNSYVEKNVSIQSWSATPCCCSESSVRITHASRSCERRVAPPLLGMPLL